MTEPATEPTAGPWRRGRALPLLVLAGLVLAPALPAVVGARGPFRLVLNLGPGDSPYVHGFTDDYEVTDRVGTHWTTHDAEISVPIAVGGGPLELSYRFARVLPETAKVDVLLDGRPVDQFTCRGGVFEERRVRLGAAEMTPLAVAFKVASHDRQGLGLKLDWVRLDGGKEARASLRGSARWRATILIALVALVFLGAGWRAGQAALLLLPVSAAAMAGLWLDPWLTHRLLTGVPEAVAALGVLGLGLGRWFLARGGATQGAVRSTTALAAAAFLLRALAVNHPDFYYPDLRTHARLVAFVREGGLDFFRTPSSYIWRHGTWRTEAYGRTYAFPYTPAFHIPFAALGLPIDTLITTMKLAAAAVSLAPLILVFAMARCLGASALGAALMVVIPTYTSRLSFAFLPALFGHAFDTAFLFWLLLRRHRIREARFWLTGAVFVAACQLSYISGVMNISLLIAALALLDPLDRPLEVRVRQGLAILSMGLFGSLLSVLVYYRDFLGMVFDLARGPLSGEGPSASGHAVQGWLTVIYARTRDFFGFVYPALAIPGLALLARRGDSFEGGGGRPRGLLLAWIAAYLLLLLGRAKVPDIFLHGHETLFVTPLVCLAAGEALARLREGGAFRKVGGGAILAFLAAEGLWLQWKALAAQMANAR